MGQIVKQDMAVSLRVMHALQELVEKEWALAESLREKARVASVGAWIIIAFCHSFRGPEVFLVDLYGLRKYYHESPSYEGSEYIMIPLLGRFKNELGDQYHLTPMAARTNSGLEIKRWVGRLVEVREKENRTHGPAFTCPQGQGRTVQWYEREILERIQLIQELKPELIQKEVQVLEEYGLSRSFRRGATSEARARGVDPDTVDLTNRWRNFEGGKGRRPRLTMRDHYSDIRLLIPAMVRFSQGL